MNAFTELAGKRRSVRGYREERIPAEVLEEILDAGRRAPSACNRQPWRFLLIEEEADRRALGAAYAREWFWKAPVILVLCVLPDEAWTRPYDGENYAMVDGAIAMDHIQLAAAAAGVGTCWIGAFDPAAAKHILGLPDGVRIVGMTPMGFPDTGVRPRAWARRPLGETVMRGCWR